MKKSALTLLVVFMANVAFAQVGAGIKAGVNFANQDIDEIESSSRTGFHFGAFFDINFSDNLALQPEILFSKQGGELSYGSAKNDIDLTYLNIPVLLKLKFAGIANIHFGPQFGILNRAEWNDVDYREEFKSSDLSLAVGAGLNLPMGVTGGVRYVFGLSDNNDTFNPTEFNLSSAPEIKNKTLQIYLGLKLFGN